MMTAAENSTQSYCKTDTMNVLGKVMAVLNCEKMRFDGILSNETGYLPPPSISDP